MPPTAQRSLEAFLEQAIAPSADPQPFFDAAQRLYAACQPLSPSERSEVLRQVAGTLEGQPPQHIQMTAMLCGALIEHGADPQPLAAPLLGILRSSLPDALRLLERFEAVQAQAPAGLDEEEPSGPRDALLQAEVEAHPDWAAAWQTQDALWRPAVALLSSSAAARAQAQDLYPGFVRLGEQQEGAHWIAKLLEVLHDEPLLVLEPQTGLGIEARMSGVADNFQLNMLLMGLFPHTGTPQPRISAAALALAQGDGPMELEEATQGHWNLHTHQGWTGQLEALNSDTWIWNEGTPRDIPVFDGWRVVLLGPPAYIRTWTTCRVFDALKATLHITRVLTPQEVQHWLHRFATSVQA